MIRALYSSRTGMSAQQLLLDTLSNNLANVNTAGFKKSRVQFEDLFYQTMKAAGAETADGSQIPSGIQVGMGVQPTAVQKIFTQGDYVQTNNELDWAIEGRGFFQILRNGEEYYTRAGTFTRDSEGYIVTHQGDRVQPEFAIPIDTHAVQVTQDGFISALDSDQNVIASAQLSLHKFINPAGLRAVGGNLFQETEASGPSIENNPGIDGMGTISQRYMETSNVDVTEELVNLIITQRAFEVNSKSVTTSDRLLEIANSLVR